MSAADQTMAIMEMAERDRFALAQASMIDLVKAEAPVKSGATRNAVVAERSTTQGTLWSVEIAARTPQAFYTEVGTGLFGPEAALIRPQVAKALHWIDGGKDVFAMSSKGSGKHKGWFSNATKRWPDLLAQSSLG